MKKRIIVSVVTLTLVLFVFGTFSAMAAEKPKMGGTLKIAHSKSAGVIGVPMGIWGWNHEFIDNTLQSLLMLSNENLGDLLPALATSWELADDRSYYIFNLRKGVTFHDGTPFNAQAVKWNHDKYVGSGKNTMAQVTSIEIIDDYTLKYNLSSWTSITLDEFAGFSFIISPTAFEKNGEEWAKYNPIGTGPFKFAKGKRNTYLMFDKFKDYWGDKPYLDSFHFYTVPDPMTCMAALMNKEVDAWLGVDTVSARKAINEGYLAVQQFDAVYNVIQFNSVDSESPWSNVKLRKAMEHGIDKPLLVKAINRGLGRPVYTVIHSIDLMGKDIGTTPRTYDVAKAKQLMKEAGYPDGLKVKILYASNPVTKDLVTAIQGMLGEIGIKLLPTPLSGALYNAALFQPTPHGDLILGNLRGGGGDVIGSTKENFGAGSVFFQSVKKPDGFQNLIDRALLTDDKEKILDLMIEAEKLAYDEFAMDVPLFQGMFTGLSQPYVKNAVWFWGGRPMPMLDKTWLDK